MHHYNEICCACHRCQKHKRCVCGHHCVHCGAPMRPKAVLGKVKSIAMLLLSFLKG